MIATYWAGLSLFMKVVWGVTLVSTLIFVIQSIMTFIGADTSGISDLDAGFGDPSSLDGLDSGMNLYTFRNLVNFTLGFGWTIIIMESPDMPRGLLVTIAILVGLGLVVVVMYLFKWLSSMQQSGNVNVYKSAVGCSGKVYLTIPEERKGEGKVQITISNAVREYNAITDGEKLNTGTPIKVIEVINEQTLLVDKVDSYII